MTAPTPDQLRALTVDYDAARDIISDIRNGEYLTWEHGWEESNAGVLEALLRVVEEAPHADDCSYLEEDVVEPIGTRVSPHAHCTCWKADAL